MKNNKVETEGYNYIGVFLTFACPRGCSYCLNESGSGLEKRATVSGEEWINGLNGLVTDLQLTFNGGEPLSHPDFFSIVNGLDESFKADLLTTLPVSAQKFIDNLDPERFERDLPYSAIRVTFHPTTMDLDETIKKVKTIRSAGFDIMINLVNHPYEVEYTNRYRKQIQEAGIPCVVKPFLGYLDGVLFGQYRYEGACSGKFRKTVECKTSVLLIDPIGDVYRCHGDMFARNTFGLVGNLFEGELDLSQRTTLCENFGNCHPCDVQTKFDRLGRWGYAAMDITGNDIIIVNNPKPDWR